MKTGVKIDLIKGSNIRGDTKTTIFLTTERERERERKQEFGRRTMDIRTYAVTNMKTRQTMNLGRGQQENYLLTFKNVEDSIGTFDDETIDGPKFWDGGKQKS